MYMPDEVVHETARSSDPRLSPAHHIPPPPPYLPSQRECSSLTPRRHSEPPGTTRVVAKHNYVYE